MGRWAASGRTNGRSNSSMNRSPKRVIRSTSARLVRRCVSTSGPANNKVREKHRSAHPTWARLTAARPVANWLVDTVVGAARTALILTGVDLVLTNDVAMHTCHPGRIES